MALYSTVLAHQWNNHSSTPFEEQLADESLVSIQVGDALLTQLLASNDSLVELTVGHLATEYDLLLSNENEVSVNNHGNHCSIRLQHQQQIQVPVMPRIVTTSCGGCNSPSIEGLFSSIPYVESKIEHISMKNIYEIYQTHFLNADGFAKTGGMHSAGLITTDGVLQVVKEDIGRHNAVDKALGHSILMKYSSQVSALLVSGRIGWDIVAKAGRRNIEFIFGLGAASSLAVDAARSCNMTIVSFLKETSCVIIGAGASKIMP